MSDLKPCKCRCGAHLEYVETNEDHDWSYHHPRGEGCILDYFWVDEADVDRWNALHSDTPALLRGARIGLEMAAKKVEPTLLEYRLSNMAFEDGGDPYQLRDLMTPPNRGINEGEEEIARMADEVCGEIVSIPDTDIMKEISREE